MKRTFLKLHGVRGVSERASKALTQGRVDERTSRPLSAKARQAGLAMLEAYGDRRFPSEKDTLTFFDEAEPEHARWLREQMAQAEKNLREMEREEFWMGEHDDNEDS